MLQKTLLRLAKEQGLKLLLKLTIDVLNDLLVKLNSKDGSMNHTPQNPSNFNPHA